VSFLPRRLYADFLDQQPIIGRVGFVGRLDHPPNLQGLTLLLEALTKQGQHPDFRLVGAPVKYGKALQQRFSFVQYLGELSDMDLENELSTWAFFTNPVWWYSTGASTKLARAISWGLPIISSTAGRRGYEWKAGALLMAETPAAMAEQLIKEAGNLDRIHYWKEQTKLIAASGLDKNDLADRIRVAYQ
jgi:glycosyltransferase involved in cell wall biosynthesis